MLRFRNGDRLHGGFSGVTEDSTILWQRKDLSDRQEWKPSELRQIVLRGGRPEVSLRGLSHIGTVNGDRIPGTVRELDDRRLLLETEFAGLLEIPREQVGLLAPSPLGGRVLYNGPFEEDGWVMLGTEHPDGLPAEILGDGEKSETPLWRFSGSAWYWQNQKMGTALVKKSGVPARSVIRFDLAWKNRLSLAVAFHSDFIRPRPDDGDGEQADGRKPQTSSLPGLFGKSYVLHLYSNYVTLCRTTFDEEGNARPEQVRANNTSVRLGDSGNASVEIRCNRPTGEISLFIDGEFVAQWSEVTDEKGIDHGYAGPGDGMGFVVQAEDSPVRISEILVAEWNGMPDAARSMEVDDADVVLLSNGTDRIAGTVRAIRNGTLTLESRYGEFSFPVEEIAEVRFAKSRLTPSVESTGEEMMIRLHPIGRISGRPLGGDARNIRVLNGAAGEINLNLDSAVMLEFESSASFLDDWDVDF